MTHDSTDVWCNCTVCMDALEERCKRRQAEYQAQAEADIAAGERQRKRQRIIRIVFFPMYLLLMILMAIVYLCFFAFIDLCIIITDAYHPGQFELELMWSDLLPWLKRLI